MGSMSRTAARQLAKVIATTAALVLIAGCGSSDGAKSTTRDSTASNDDTAPAGVDATSSPGGGGSSSGGPKLPVQNVTYGVGRIHVEFGGDLGGAVEIDGSGIVTNGFANFGFADTASGAAVVFAVGGDEGSV